MPNFPFSRNYNCVVRNQKCGRMFSSSNTAFIASPGAESVALELEIIKNILENRNIEPYVALENYNPAHDIFCEKICAKIIESKLCVVLLTDPVLSNGSISPNPNVYYEYGLMTAFGKHIIPLQRNDNVLAFNVHSLDTIKFTNKNIKNIFEKVLISTLEIVLESENNSMVTGEPLRMLHLFMEFNGFRFINGMMSKGTPFRHFSKHDNSQSRFGLVIRNENDINGIEQHFLLILSRLKNVVEKKRHKLNNLLKNAAEYEIKHQEKMINISVNRIQDEIDNIENNTDFIIVCPNNDSIKNKIEHVISNASIPYNIKTNIFCLDDILISNNL